jgi:hypothetical protein
MVDLPTQYSISTPPSQSRRTETNFFIFLRCAARFDQYSSNTIVLFSPRAYVCQKERIESDHSGARDGLEYFFAIAAIAKSSIAAFLGVAWSPPPKIGTTALATHRATQSYNNLATLFYLEAVGVQSPRLRRFTPNPRPWSTLPLHSKWNLACAVKHFHDKRK